MWSEFHKDPFIVENSTYLLLILLFYLNIEIYVSTKKKIYYSFS